MAQDRDQWWALVNTVMKGGGFFYYLNIPSASEGGLSSMEYGLVEQAL
jgi:hypothetical protein